MATAIDPAGTLKSTVQAAAAGDIEATAWLQLVAPDLAEDKERMGLWLDQWECEDLDKNLRIASELDHYVDTIHERTLYHSN